MAETIDQIVRYWELRHPYLAYTKPKKDGSTSRPMMAGRCVLHGAYERLPEDGHGNDRWRVGHHVCSLRGNYCSCKDFAADTKLDGKLCYHRLTLLILKRYEGNRNPLLLDLVKDAADNHESFIELIMYREYSNTSRPVLGATLPGNPRGERAVLLGYRLPGQSRTTLRPDMAVDVTPAQLADVLDQVGWVLSAAPEKLPQFEYAYLLCPADEGVEGVAVTPEHFYEHGRTDAMDERDRVYTMLAEDLADDHALASMPGTNNLPDYVYQRAAKVEGVRRFAGELNDQFPLSSPKKRAKPVVREVPLEEIPF